MESDREYFERRARDERGAAKKEVDDKASRARAELADRYSDMAEVLRAYGLRDD